MKIKERAEIKEIGQTSEKKKIMASTINFNLMISCKQETNSIISLMQEFI